MTRYTPNLLRHPGEPYLYESDDGGYVLAKDVIDEFGAIQKELVDLKEKLAKVSYGLSAVIFSLSQSTR